MGTYTIRPLCLGIIKRPKTNMVYNCGDGSIVDFPLIAYYLEGNGHKILVDTGGSAPDGEHWMPYTRSPEQELPAQLRAIGASPEEIDTVILTHLHWDHNGNNHFLPNARFIVQKSEAADLSASGVETHIAEKTVYETVDGDVEIFPGVSVVLAPGHSPGMQCVIVETENGKVMLTGDLIPMYENWEKLPRVPGGFYDLDTCMKSIEKIGPICDTILPGHDIEVFSRCK